VARILMVTHSHSPDKRIDQEAEYLAKEQYEIHLICGKRKPTESTPTYYKSIHTIPLLKTQQAFLSIPVRKAAKKYLKIIKEIQPDIIHAHDLMAANVVSLILPKGTKFIFDDHEIMELKRKNKAQRSPNIAKKIVRYILYLLSIRARKKVMKKANSVIVVNNYFIEFYRKRGVDHKKIIVLENFPKKELISKALAQKELVDEFFINDPRKKLVHSTSTSSIEMDLDRNVNSYIEAINKLDDWVMVIFGPNVEEMESKGVRFIQRKPILEYLVCVAHCNVTIHAPLIDERSNHASPNRVFESALLGVQVISNKVSSLLEKMNNMIIWLEEEEIPPERITEILNNIEKYPSGKELQEYAKDFVWEKQIDKLINQYRILLKEN